MKKIKNTTFFPIVQGSARQVGQLIMYYTPIYLFKLTRPSETGKESLPKKVFLRDYRSRYFGFTK